MTRPWNWLSFLAGLGSALIILGGIWIGIAATTAQQASDQEAYERCLAQLGVSLNVDSGEVDWEALDAATQICSDL